MNKKTIIIIVVVSLLIAGLGVGGFIYLQNLKKAKATGGLGDVGNMPSITDSATQGVLPSIQTNPLEDKPDLNPVDKTNPYKNINTNPFK